jgi:hypothetical protein
VEISSGKRDGGQRWPDVEQRGGAGQKGGVLGPVVEAESAVEDGGPAVEAESTVEDGGPVARVESMGKGDGPIAGVESTAVG